jgi:hypothetical protein
MTAPRVDTVAVAKWIQNEMTAVRAQVAFDKCLIDWHKAYALARVVLAAAEFVRAEDAAMILLLVGGKASDAEVEMAHERTGKARHALAAALKGKP